MSSPQSLEADQNDSLATQDGNLQIEKVCSASSQREIFILFTKSECSGCLPDNEYTKAIEQTQIDNIKCFYISPVQFEFINSEMLSSCLSHLEEYSGIILTSIRCIDAMESVLKTLGDNEPILENMKKLKIFTVGQSTSKHLKESFNLDSIGHQSGSSTKLAQFILEDLVQLDVSNLKPLLYPCSSIRSDTLLETLQKSQVPIHEVPVYNTNPNENIHQNLNEFRLSMLQPSSSSNIELIVIFFSPSGVDALNRPLKQFQTDHPELVQRVKTKFVAFGQLTSHRMIELGLQVWFVASAPNAQALAFDLKTHLQSF